MCSRPTSSRRGSRTRRNTRSTRCSSVRTRGSSTCTTIFSPFRYSDLGFYADSVCEPREDFVDSGASAVVFVAEQVPVDVQRCLRGRVAEPGLNHLHEAPDRISKLAY